MVQNELQGVDESSDDFDEASEISNEPASNSPAYDWRPATSEIGMRLDVFITSRLLESTRSEVQRLIELPEEARGGVRINGKRTKSNYKLRGGESISLERPQPNQTTVEAENIPLKIVYEDEELLVIDKARGMVVHPAPGAEKGTLVNAVLFHAKNLSGIGGELRPGIVHRLDKDTGGLILVAKTDFAHRSLQAQIQARTAERRYLALVWGNPNFEQAKVEAPIGRHPVDRKKMSVHTDAKHVSREAITDLTVKTRFGGSFTLLEAKLHTGRTHQIRVHCAYIFYPVVGDPTYGGLRKVPSHRFEPPVRVQIEAAIEALGGQALHAYSLAFDHPRNLERMAFLSPLPDQMQSLLSLLPLS